MRTLIAATVGVVMIAATVYSARTLLAGTDGPAPLPAPRVEGRQMSVIEAVGETGAWTTYCEFDAWVTVRGQEVIAIEAGDDRHPVKSGELIVESIGEPGEEHSSIHAWRGSDGKLHTGCAPESVKITH